MQTFSLSENNGQFIYPNFTGIQQISSNMMLSGQSLSAFASGEKAEFNERTFEKQDIIILSSLNYSSGSGDS